jgi:hypothetical protein
VGARGFRRLQGDTRRLRQLQTSVGEAQNFGEIIVRAALELFGLDHQLTIKHATQESDNGRRESWP